MNFEIISNISQIEVIAVGSSIQDLPRLTKTLGGRQPSYDLYLVRV